MDLVKKQKQIMEARIKAMRQKEKEKGFLLLQEERAIDKQLASKIYGGRR